jgi:hypothetical protein
MDYVGNRRFPAHPRSDESEICSILWFFRRPDDGRKNGAAPRGMLCRPASRRYFSNQNQSPTCFQLCSDLVSQNLTTSLFCERVQDTPRPTHPDQTVSHPTKDGPRGMRDRQSWCSLYSTRTSGNNPHSQDTTPVSAVDRAQSLLMRFVPWCFFSFLGRCEAPVVSKDAVSLGHTYSV